MGIMKSVLLGLFPKGHPWQFPEKFKSVIEALSLSLDRVKIFLRGILLEANPGTATDLLPEWYAELGLSYDETKTLTTRQSRAKQVYSSTGGQNKNYIQDQIQISYPDVVIEEYFTNPENMVGLAMVGDMQVQGYPSWLPVTPTDGSFPVHYYRVIGEVDDISDLYGLKNLLNRIAPLTHEPVYEITIRNQTATSEVGLAMVGLAQVGRGRT